ncbi:MAG: LytTR family DNA-binding domain-containing protein [Gemmatimonadota bacterium]|nr:LytTR family DNA-binding domain-containing protein [Gemmatimonadota bacterium]
MSAAKPAPAKMVRALLVDDEPLARTRLRTLLASDPEIEIIGECGNGADAVEAIEEQRPDLVFLDIQMPELDGFGVVEAVGVERMPLVIFVTAYDEHALQAFEVYALDYLLKPVDRDRFAATLARAKARLAAKPSATAPPDAQQLQPLLDHLGRRQRRDARLAIKTEGRVLFVRTQDIDWIEAVDNNAKIHVGKETHLIRDTLSRLEQRLSGGRFMRIHRSTIVNMERVKELQPWFQGDFVVILADGTRLTSGRSYRQRLQAFVKEAM